MKFFTFFILVLALSKLCFYVEFPSLMDVIKENKFMLGSIMLCLGIMMTYIGRKILIFFEIIIGYIVVFDITLYFIRSIISVEEGTFLFAVIRTIITKLSEKAGYFMYKFGNSLAATILCGTLGFIIRKFLFMITLKYNPKVDYLCFTLLVIILCSLIGYWLADIIIIILTSIIGAFGVMRVNFILSQGVTFILGQNSNEREVYNLIIIDRWDQARAV